ncbi:MAG: chitobiase/beta-hexosaminidase C-terminal domain-containing protein [Fibrobacterota bacterium]|nr:MAG: chitobiase/beta-hexosaminidase C-terminal domain-containing protein [Fibrobacterota bacterium]
MSRFSHTPLCMALLTLSLLSSCDSGSANSPTNTDNGAGAATGSVAAPTFSPAGGTYTDAQSVTISSATEGATIYYSFRAIPTTNSSQYTEAITVSASKTIIAIAVKNGTKSAPSYATYTVKTSGGASDPIPWNSTITYGSLTDSRDSKVYKTVKIGSQTWMAENLNYQVDGSWCYANKPESCIKYGRLYSWSATMGLDTVYNSTNWNGASPQQGNCPSGWHVPSDAEWTVLKNYAGGDSTAGMKLKSTSGWDYSSDGTDNYGFRAQPAGLGLVGHFDGLGRFVGFWSSSENGASKAGSCGMLAGFDAFLCENTNSKVGGLSVRCIEGAGTPPPPAMVAAPTFSVTGGTYSDRQLVTLSSSTDGSIIYFTTDGSTPTTSSKRYNSPIEVDSTKTLNAIATKSGMTTSAVRTSVYTIKLGPVAQPTFSPASGTYASAQNVTLSSTTIGSTIYFTTDGTTPTTSSTKYTSPIEVNLTLPLKAIAVKEGRATSSVSYVVFTIESRGNSSEPIPWNKAINYGVLTDARDGRVYKTVAIGAQTWMAENLNFKVDSSWCPMNSEDSCGKYGRLYQWAAAMGLDTIYNNKFWRGTLPRQGVCPTGWHVPSDAEWTKLTDTLFKILGSNDGNTVLKSVGGWPIRSGVDYYGFRVLPAGARNPDGSTPVVGIVAMFWSSSEPDSYGPWMRSFSDGYAALERTNYTSKPMGYSLRCLEN